MDALCSFFDTLINTYALPITGAIAVVTILVMGIGYILSGLYPEALGNLRQFPKNLVIGVMIILIGPALIAGLLSAAGIESMCTF